MTSTQATFINFPQQGKVTVATEPVSADGLGPMEVVVRSETSIISAGTELARLHNVLGDGRYPLRPGYGTIGRVEAKGEAVDDFAIGDRVFFAGKHASLQRFTHGQNHQWGRLYPVPDGLDPIDAVFVCMAEISQTAVNVAELMLNDTVAVFGLGLIGNLAAQQFAIAGARVIGVDPQPARCELARKVGIERTIDAAPGKQVDALLEMTEGKGAHVTVDAAGHSAVIANCVFATARYGQVVLLGSPRAGHETNVTPIFSKVHEQGLVVRGAHMWRLLPYDAIEVPRTVAWACGNNLDLIARGRLKVRELLTHTLRPEDVPDAYDGLAHRGADYIGAVIDWR